MEPTEGTVQPGEILFLEVQVCILATTVNVEELLRTAKGELKTTFVVNLEGGGGLFLSAEAKYVPSCWGLRCGRSGIGFNDEEG